ncbi:uncharacterized protein ColSpa_11138 [Colletotrichum spaethianum]|uniref:Uncharacterized protein n=1 Tax=Colletotrichum spaethianum TaxID=700344 RepID=A0AA37URK8_9PEZI|nr:uncharacterized protein ColSpa_11138 [Colletotrichum spaethianum]GKT50957.1 hypothetical protein ColSpa_11138 [Colletotrichum spaethianum]
MASSPTPAPQSRPRITPYRCILRLRDRLELFLERYIDGDRTAQTGFETYKTGRNRRWAEKDAKKRKEKGPAAAVAISIINSPADKTPAENPVYSGVEAVSPVDLVDEEVGLNIPKTRGKYEGKEKAIYTEDDADTGQASRATGGSAARPQTSAPQLRNISRSSAFSSFVESTLGEQRRRKRKRSDARPGYFDPDPFPQEPSCGTNATGAGVEDEDRLEMNVPVEVARRSWTVPIGTAR